MTVIYSSKLNNSGIKFFVVFKDTGSLGKCHSCVLGRGKTEREQRDSRKDRQRETNRERIAQGKKKLYLYVIESDGIVLEELGESFQNLFNPKHH